MEWLQVFTILGTNMAVFLWSRSEARHDQLELRQISRQIQDEMKDFHARMCILEEKKK